MLKRVLRPVLKPVLKSVLQKFTLLFVLSFIVACKPANEQNMLTSQKGQQPQCIGSQSQCEIKTELASFSVKFTQMQLSQNIKTELPFAIELTELSKCTNESNITNITKVSAYLEGKEMFMGKVPVFFEQKAQGNAYVAQSLLANCTEEQMVWRLWITVVTSGNSQTFFIDFTSQRL